MRSSDNTAPRFRAPWKYVWNKEIYNSFPAEIKELYDIKTCKAIVKAFGNLVHEEVRNNRQGVRLPCSLGIIVAGTCPRKKRINPNWKKSLEYNKVVNHGNWESDQKTGKIFYTNSNNDGYPTFINGNLWSFRADQFNRKAFAYNYRENWMNYVEVPPWLNISKLYRKNSFKLYKRKQQENYNPYD